MRTRWQPLRGRVEEQAGWRPTQKPEFVMTFQPMIGNADSPQDLYFAKGAVEVGRPISMRPRESPGFLGIEP